MRDFIMKVQLLLTICSLSHAAYISRVTNNRIRSPAVFRPGVALHRPWTQRLVQASSNRAPYVLYRNPPQRYAVKQYQPRHVLSAPWKTTPRLPLSPTPQEYEFIRAATAQQIVHTDGGTESLMRALHWALWNEFGYSNNLPRGFQLPNCYPLGIVEGAIHTIPAPNLSFSEKPIVVVDALENSPVSEASKPTYEVTEKQEPMYQMAKIEMPAGFSKVTSMNSPELQTLIRNGAALQYASEFGLSAISLPPNPVVQQPPQSHQIQQAPQQFAIQGFSNLPSQQELINSGAEGIVIPPNALYQPDPMFLQKLQAQLLQRFPAVEFIPYVADSPPVPISPKQPPQQPQLLLLENEELKPEPSSFVPSIPHKNIVQRETQENSIVTLIPQAFVVNNVSEKPETTSFQPHNITLELVAAESQPVTTTIKYVIEDNTEEQNTTPVYYAQVGQSVRDVVAKEFYSAMNDVRAAALAQVENPQETKIEEEKATTAASEIKSYVMKEEDEVKNETVNELKPLLGVPFAKPADSVNVTYTLLRSSDVKPKMTQEGTVYAGQIVEATISEDQDFNKAKATFLSRRAPIRLVAVSENDIATAASSGIVPQIDIPRNSSPKLAVVKAKIPPKSKLIFDDKTGEPVLRIYASYLDSPAHKELIVTKLANLRRVKEVVTKKDSVDNWKASTVKSVDKSQGFDGNQVTQFGLKLRVRSDDYVPLFEEYEESLL